MEDDWRLQLHHHAERRYDGVFDIVIPTEKGAIYCVYLKRDGEMANVATADDQQAVTTMTIKQAHDRLGHNNEDATRLAPSTWALKFLPED